LSVAVRNRKERAVITCKRVVGSRG